MNFFFTNFSMVTEWYMIIMAASEIPWNRIWYLNFDETKKKRIRTLVETHINHDQIHHIINNWLDACPASFRTWRLTLTQKGGLFPLSLLHLMTEFSVFMPLQDIAPGKSWIGCLSLKDHKIIWKIKIS